MYSLGTPFVDHGESRGLTQGSFWVCAQPMRDNITTLNHNARLSQAHAGPLNALLSPPLKQWDLLSKK